MYKIPEDFDISKLSDKTITSISYGINFISLFFEDGFIQILNSFVINANNNSNRYENLYPIKNDFGLLVLLEKQIIDIKTSKDREILHLFFDGNIDLLIHGDKMYESFEINYQDEQIIV